MIYANQPRLSVRLTGKTSEIVVGQPFEIELTIKNESSRFNVNNAILFLWHQDVYKLLSNWRFQNLEPSQSEKQLYTFLATAEDVERGVVSFKAVAESENTRPFSIEIKVPVNQKASLTVQFDEMVPAYLPASKRPYQASYTITVRNDGYVPLHQLSLSDQHPFRWINPKDLPNVLSPNEKVTLNYEFDGTLPELIFIEGDNRPEMVPLFVEATCQEILTPVSAVEAWPIGWPNVGLQLEIQKSEVWFGETIPYRLRAVNLGATAYDLTIHLLSANQTVLETIPIAELEGDNRFTHEGELPLQSDWCDSGFVSLQAQLPSTFGQRLVNTESYRVEILCPEMTITLRPRQRRIRLGEPIPYRLIVKNTGNMPLTDIWVMDKSEDERGASWPYLEIGDVKTFELTSPPVYEVDNNRHCICATAVSEQTSYQNAERCLPVERPEREIRPWAWILAILLLFVLCSDSVITKPIPFAPIITAKPIRPTDLYITLNQNGMINADPKDNTRQIVPFTVTLRSELGLPETSEALFGDVLIYYKSGFHLNLERGCVNVNSMTQAISQPEKLLLDTPIPISIRLADSEFEKGDITFRAAVATKDRNYIYTQESKTPCVVLAPLIDIREKPAVRHKAEEPPEQFHVTLVATSNMADEAYGWWFWQVFLLDSSGERHPILDRIEEVNRITFPLNQAGCQHFLVEVSASPRQASNATIHLSQVMPLCSPGV